MASNGNSTSFWQRLQQLPRGVIYTLLAAVVIWQLVWPIQLPVKVSPATTGVYEAIRQVPADKLVIVSTDWDSSTMAETGPQTVAIVTALFQQKKKFALMNLQPPAGIKLANDRVQKVADDYGAKYGTDWINWGYKYGYDNVVMQLARNIPAAVKKDYHGTPISDLRKLPIMRGVKDIREIGLVIEITGLNNLTESWISLIHGPYKVPFAAGYTAVMAPGYAPYMDTGQLSGMLVGAKGAAELEVIIATPGQGLAIMSAQSAAHVLIILLIILGNIGYVLAKRANKKKGLAA